MFRLIKNILSAEPKELRIPTFRELHSFDKKQICTECGESSYWALAQYMVKDEIARVIECKNPDVDPSSKLEIRCRGNYINRAGDSDDCA